MAQDFIELIPKKRWYRQWWFIVLVIAGALWFGLPLLLPLIPGNNIESSKDFTAVPGAKTLSTSQPIDVTSQDDPAWGIAAAPVVIVEFGDFQCPFCREAEAALRQVRQKYSDGVRFIYRDFPIADIHSEAIAAAEAANCAGQQGKYWPYHDQLFVQQDNLGSDLYQSLAQSLGLEMDKFNRCLQGRLTLAEIKDDYEAGLAAGVSGTPTFFVNGYPVRGVLPFDAWQQIIAAVLKAKFQK